MSKGMGDKDFSVYLTCPGHVSTPCKLSGIKTVSSVRQLTVSIVTGSVKRAVSMVAYESQASNGLDSDT